MKDDFATYNRLWAEYFTDERSPAARRSRSNCLPTPIAIELKCIASIEPEGYDMSRSSEPDQFQQMDRRASPSAQAAGGQSADLGRPRVHGDGRGRAELAHGLSHQRRRGVFLPGRRRHGPSRARERASPVDIPIREGRDFPASAQGPALAAAPGGHGRSGARAQAPARTSSTASSGSARIAARSFTRNSSTSRTS